MTRIQFYCLLMRLDALKEERYDVSCREQDALNARVVAEARKLKPRWKWGKLWPVGWYSSSKQWYASNRLVAKARELLDDATNEDLNWRTLARATYAWAWLDLQIERVELELNDIADALPALPGPMRRYSTVWDVSYNSQGFGAAGYARRAVEADVEHARRHGIEGEVRRGKGCSEAWLAVAGGLDLEILRRKPPPPFAEQVRACWARGCNPRVMNPWLPHGFEEKVGIDYFGKVVDKEKFKRACART